VEVSCATMVCFRLREDAVACKRRDHHRAVAAQAVVLLQGKHTRRAKQED
jgi:hypothetical protein